ncbi:MAG: glucose-6-phosphate isomerase, partial [Muribaculaceae bacterium]|nr:glucose-6-phosphate isomerase [Muribaculaceae bacterium]
MKQIELNVDQVLGVVSEADIQSYDAKAADAMTKLATGSGEGNDFLGWLDLPTRTPAELIESIESTAALLRKECEVVVAIGIGGSYLGAKAVIEALKNSFTPCKPELLFAGQNIGEDYLAELQAYLKGKRFGIIVISKSGTTTEPAIAFRLLKEQLEAQVGKADASKLIVAITDAKRGALRSLATTEGYKTFVIDDNVGGRFSVLSPVGLLPIAVAGYDIRALINGAIEMEKATAEPGNIAERYAEVRNALYNAGKKIEILVNYNPKLHYFGEWWKQLYGESDGKVHKGIFTAAVDHSPD